MFQKIKWHLTIVNGLVVTLILIVISISLYYYMDKAISSETDRNIEEQMFDVKEALVDNTFLGTKKFPTDPRSITILSYQNDVTATWPENQYIIDDTNQITKLKNGFSNIVINGNSFRVLTSTYQFGSIERIHILWTIDSEVEQLLLLKKILIIGTIFGSLISIFIGRFLTQQALVPIKKSWNQQERFVGDASHELRTPLAVIQNQAESLLQNPEETIYENSDAISKILKESQKMKRLLSDLLLLAKSDSNEVIIQKQTFTIEELAEDIVMYFEDIAVMQEAEFQVNLEYKGEMEGDLERIQQLLIILLDNAFKYSSDSEKPVIKLSCNLVNNKVAFSVKDNGIGIAKEHIPHIFDRFYRVEKARSRSSSQGGYGLGLSIAKWLVDAHQGIIEVKSEENKGTEFIITFPKHKKG